MSFLLGILFALNANAQTEITNLNFESWNGTEPSNWTTSNELSTDGGGVQTAFKETTNPGEGSASLKLVTGRSRAATPNRWRHKRPPAPIRN